MYCLVHEHATAFAAPRTAPWIHVVIVSAAPAKYGDRAEYRQADLPFPSAAFMRCTGRVEAPLADDPELHPGSSRGRDHPVSVFDAVRHRFLNQHMFAPPLLLQSLVLPCRG